MSTESLNLNKEKNLSLDQLKPQVSVVIPVLNEEKYIEECINSILSQDYPKDDLEVIFVDGNSDDNTFEIIKNFSKEYSFIKIYSNPLKTVQCALNIGIKASNGIYIVRMDAHTEYSNDYISKCIEYLKKTGADNVGGPMIARGKNNTQKVIAAAYHSPFALGGGSFHKENFSGYADTVYLGSFKKETLISIDMYDDRLPRSEDDDLNFRIQENGGKIYITPDIKSVYYPRDSYISLFKQYFEYGLWKVAVIKKHKKPARISHLVPVSFVLFIILFSVLSFFYVGARILFSSILLVYTLLNIIYSFKNPYVTSFSNKLRLMYVHFILHVSYGLGFLCGIFKFLRYKF